MQFLQAPAYVKCERTTVSPTKARSSLFTELQCSYQLPLYDTSIITNILTTVDTPSTRKDELGSKSNDGSGLPGSSSSPQSSTPTIHIATVAPLALYTILPDESLSRPCIRMPLHSFLPALGNNRPRLRLWKGANNMVGLYEELTNTVLLADPINGEVLTLGHTSFLEKMTHRVMQQQQGNRCAPSGDHLLVYTPDKSSLSIVSPVTGKVHNVNLGFNVTSVTGCENSDGLWFVNSEDGKVWLFDHRNLEELKPINFSDGKFGMSNLSEVSSRTMSQILTDHKGEGGMIAPGGGNHATLFHGLSAGSSDEEQISSGQVYVWPRKIESQKSNKKRTIADQNTAEIADTGQLVSVISELPKQAPTYLRDISSYGYLEVADISQGTLHWLPIPKPADEQFSDQWYWQSGRMQPSVRITSGSEGSLTSIDRTGGLGVWQVGGGALQRSLDEWASMVGDEEGRLDLDRDTTGADMSLDAPKHGKVDPDNKPHVGGNTWMGGTGGRDTAGMGGIGGPYRLDGGHDVHQVSDEVKASVPKEVREAARKMGQEAYRKRLREIDMSEHENDQYESFRRGIVRQVTQLRNVLASLTAAQGERTWVRRRPDGDLDDTALVDGLTGSTNIYRQRLEVPPEAGQPQLKPKRLRLLLDASGSMYRFNGHDQRLQRSLEAALMLMEAAHGHEQRLRYDIYAHSGEEMSLPLSKATQPPDNDKKRLVLLKRALAHSQFCMSGDSTVAATRNACRELATSTEDSDQSFVVLLSDANLERYGIAPERLARAMVSEANVNCYAVFIGSLGNQAERLAQALPAGRAFVCMELNQLPSILQRIFAHAITK